MRKDLWFQNAVIYELDVKRFHDGDGDGIGDFQGLIEKLDYLVALGVDCIWLSPIFATSDRDNGYDVVDYFRIDPRLGHLGDFMDFVRQAKRRGLRVILELVVNHTSVDHEWFRRSRSGDPRYADHYVWREKAAPPDESPEQITFTEEDRGVWDYDDERGLYYLHRFYAHEPDLNTAHGPVREEIRRVAATWFEMGASGLRIDAAPYIATKAAPAYDGDGHAFLRELRDMVAYLRGDAVLMAEADVEPDRLDEFFGGGREMHLLLNFTLDAYIFLALARGVAEPLEYALNRLPNAPSNCSWANFLRNLDELDLERLDEGERTEVYKAFAPDPEMRIFERGIRRRLAPMLDGDPARLKLVTSLLFSMPGTPVVLYGDEIGMGDDLRLPDRSSVRLPMQWEPTHNGGFSSASSDGLIAPVKRDGRFGCDRVNVLDGWAEPESLLNWTRRVIGARKMTREIGLGGVAPFDAGDPRVLGLRYELEGDVVLTLHNISSEPVAVSVPYGGEGEAGADILADSRYDPLHEEGWKFTLRPHGCRWLRLWAG